MGRDGPTCVDGCAIRCDSVGRRWCARVNEYDDGDGGDGDDGVFRFGGRGGANANDDETVATTIVVFFGSVISSSGASMRAFGWGDWGDDERRRRR